jgi:hypothetical protein
MANRLNVFLSGGTGTLILTPEPGETGFYALGDVVNVSIILDAGFTFTNWTINGVEVGTSTNVSVTIGRSDITLVANATGSSAEDFTYGLRLWDEFVDDQNRKNRIEIEEKNFTGEALRVTIKNPNYSIGTNDNYPDDIFITSKLSWDFQIEKGLPDLDFLLTLDPRRYRVKWFRDYVNPSTYGFIWVGYLKTEFLEREEYRSTYEISVVATDGISDFQGYLAPVTGLDFTNAATILAELLNASFKDALPIRECIRVFENRMDVGDVYSLLEQFTVNPDCLFVDDVRFQQEGTFLIYNPSKNLTDALTTMLSSWICRVFQWNGYWYIIRVMEYVKDNLRLTTFNTSGIRTAQLNLTAKDSFACIGNQTRRGETGFTRFNTFLKLGSINRPESRDILSEDFGPEFWYNPNPRSAGDTLRRWDYINAVVFNGDRESEFAGVERTTELGNVFPRFWGTANGVADTNLSGIKWNNYFGRAAVRNADTISIECRFQVKRRGSADPAIPPAGTHLAGMQLKIGPDYLSWDGSTTFTWTTTPTNIFFPVNNTDVFNQVSIQSIVVESDGEVELTLFQLVTVSGTRHRYVVDWDDVIINLSRNDALAYKEIRAKAETEIKYSNEFENRETFIGDALTNLSSSAIILKDVANDPVSELWERQGETESEPLLGVVLADMVNLFGKNNYMIRAEIKESEAGKSLDFRKGLTYRGVPYVLTSASLDVRSGIWEMQAFQMIGEPSNAVSVNWDVITTTSGLFIDANVGFFLNGDFLTFNLGAGSGSFDIQIGDLVKIVYFYYTPKYDGSPVDPRLELIINEVLISSDPLTLGSDQEFEYIFVASENVYNITVTSAHG